VNPSSEIIAEELSSYVLVEEGAAAGNAGGAYRVEMVAGTAHKVGE
jgi:hypothetical protein